MAAWRHLVLESGSAARTVRLKADGFMLVDTKLPVIAPLPASARVRIGAPYYVNGPIRSETT